MDADEKQVIDVPNGVFDYHGQNWSDDFSLLALAMGTTDLWRIAAASFDAKGNPVFEAKKVLSDPVFTARAEGKADAIHGGNELAQTFSSDWMQADGSAKEGYFIQARGGKNFSANEGAQHKVSRYVPEAAGGYQLQWRTGRTALERLAEEGEMYGAMRVHKPINGLLSVIDQSRCGVLLFTAEDGLYVDTIFPDGRRLGKRNGGVYPQPGEFFAGVIQPNPANGRIYLGFGKYTPMLFETEGWSLTENPVHKLTNLPAKVTISAAQIATPPEIALSLRGGAGKASLARFTPALGEVALDGGLAGWESAEPVVFAQAKDQSVEVRCLYRPEELLLRWHVRLPGKFEARPLPPPERLFSHDQAADTLSFYLQGDVNAPAGGPAEGRARRRARGLRALREQGQVAARRDRHVSEVAGQRQSLAADLSHAGRHRRRSRTSARWKARASRISSIPMARASCSSRRSRARRFRRSRNRSAAACGRSRISRRRLAAIRKTGGRTATARRTARPTTSRAKRAFTPARGRPSSSPDFADGLTVRNWLICGPFGGSRRGEIRARPARRSQKGGREILRGRDLSARQRPRRSHRGFHRRNDERLLAAAARSPLETRHHRRPRQPRDPRRRRQLWYAATWIHAAAPTEVELRFQSHQMTFLRWFVNGERVPLKPADYKPGARERVPVAARKIPLRAGWNQVMVRGYCTGYSPFRLGLVLDAPEATLWNLQLSATPPK